MISSGAFLEKSSNEVPIAHEEFKSIILEMASGRYLPDIISYWAGARTQFIVDTDALAPLDDLWSEAQFDEFLPPAIAKSSSLYSAKHYLVPFGYHFTGLFYNRHVLKKAS